MISRPEWRDYFLGIALAVAARGECTRRKVGAVLVHKATRTVVATGYNGVLAGEVSCLDGVCPRASSDVPPLSQYDSGPGRCIATHAEENAVRQYRISGNPIPTSGLEIYVTRPPCAACTERLNELDITAHYMED